MKLLGVRRLCLLLVVTLLFCHGVFGGLHLACFLPECADHGQHAAKHQAATGEPGDAHEHPAGHETSIGYFAVIVGLLGLLSGLLPKGALLQTRLDARWPVVLLQVRAVFRSSLGPTPLTLQVFRL